mmetsp:Transcript_22965/g.42232  ORF Transcript_22965/g.42232 Transcript_22965/m.42232 type:complete len:315 (+) Transcript_22965:55-999(+)
MAPLPAVQPARMQRRSSCVAPAVLAWLVLVVICTCQWPTDLPNFTGMLHQQKPQMRTIPRQAIEAGMEVDRKTEFVDEESDKRLFTKLLDGVEGDFDTVELEKVYQVPTYNARFSQYKGFTYSKRKADAFRLRMERVGIRHKPFYRIQAMGRGRTAKRSTKVFEKIGYWDPTLPADHPKAFNLRADRAVYWLRNGAAVSDQVASFLDLAGIIRRTGREAKLGEWEWRIPEDTGNEAPEGWTYHGNPEHVVWGAGARLNKKLIKRERGERKGSDMEKYGFTGYKEIPLEQNVVAEPLDGTSRVRTKSWDTFSDDI